MTPEEEMRMRIWRCVGRIVPAWVAVAAFLFWWLQR